MILRTIPSSPPDQPVAIAHSPGDLVRPAVQRLKRYVPGSRADTEPADFYKLSQNENSFDPLPGVLQAAVTACATMNRYPDLAATALVQALSARLDVPADEVVVGTGSIGALQQIMQAVIRPGDEVLFAWRSFEAYRTLTQIAGGEPVTVSLSSDERHDLPAMADAITAATRLILLCTPNNPTGSAIGQSEFDDFMRRVPDGVLVVIDEAYVEFVRDRTALDAIVAYRGRPNVVVLRTFSKAYGLAGLRVGYALASAQIADAARKTAVPFGVSTVAQQSAIASLACEEELSTRIETTIAARDELRAALLTQGWTIPHSEANFLWLRLGTESAAFADESRIGGVLVRPYGEDGVRVTVGERAALDRFYDVAGAWKRTHA